MLVRSLLLTSILAATACGPLSSHKQDKQHQPTPAARAADDAALAAAKRGKDVPVDDAKTYDDDGDAKIDHDDDAPAQSPTQSPFQGNLPELTIDDVITSGAGCEPDDVAVNVSDDAKAFTVIFSDFIAELGPDAVPGKDGVARAGRQCRLALKLAVPKGYRLTVMTMDYRGFVDLEADADATLTSSVGFAGRTPQTFKHAFGGPTSEDVAIRDELTLGTVAWSQCGGTATLNVDVKAGVTAKNGAIALLALDSADGELTQKYGLAWKRCTN